MAAITASFRRPASASRRNFPENRPAAEALARVLSRKPAARNGVRHWTPKELACDLTEVHGVEVSERSIVRRCSLPADSAGSIATNPAYPGRHYIPEAEALRLLRAGKAVE